MEEVTVIFSKSYLPFSVLIRMFTFSKWSHVGIVDGTRVIESTGKHGVSEGSLFSFIDRNHAYATRKFTVTKEQKQIILDTMRSQIGKKYDFRAIFGMPFKRDWQEDDCWFCSELIAYAFDKAGVPLVSKNAVHRVTPEDIWKLVE